MSSSDMCLLNLKNVSSMRVLMVKTSSSMFETSVSDFIVSSNDFRNLFPKRHDGPLIDFDAGVHSIERNHRSPLVRLVSRRSLVRLKRPLPAVGATLEMSVEKDLPLVNQ